MSEMLIKYYPQLIIIIGVLLQIWGGTILFHRTQEYRKEANTSRDDIKNLNNSISNKNDSIIELSKKNEQLSIENSELSKQGNMLGEENRELNKQIRKLSTRISEQSEIIEKQITGGDAYGEVILLNIGVPEDVSHTFYFENKGDYPLYDVSVTVRNQKLMKQRIKEKNEKNEDPGFMTIDDLKYYTTYNLGNISKHGGKTFGNIFKLTDNEEHYYGFSITTKNGSFSQLFKIIKKGKKYYKANRLNTVNKKGEGKFKVLIDNADEGFPGEKDGKIHWEDK